MASFRQIQGIIYIDLKYFLGWRAPAHGCFMFAAMLIIPSQVWNFPESARLPFLTGFRKRRRKQKEVLFPVTH